MSKTLNMAMQNQRSRLTLAFSYNLWLSGISTMEPDVLRASRSLCARAASDSRYTWLECTCSTPAILQHAGHDAGKDFTGSLQQFVAVGGVVHQSWSAQDQRFWREIAQPDRVWPATRRLAVGNHAAARHQACQRSLLNKVWSLNRYPRIS